MVLYGGTPNRAQETRTRRVLSALFLAVLVVLLAALAALALVAKHTARLLKKIA